MLQARLPTRLAIAALTILIAAVPAAAQDASSHAPADDPQAYGGEDCIDCSGMADDAPTAPADCGGEVCAFGEDGCIDCLGGPTQEQADEAPTSKDAAGLAGPALLAALALALVAMRRQA